MSSLRWMYSPCPSAPVKWQHKKMKFCINDFFSKSEQMRSFQRIRSHSIKKSWMENFIFCAVDVPRWLPRSITLLKSLPQALNYASLTNKLKTILPQLYRDFIPGDFWENAGLRWIIVFSSGSEIFRLVSQCKYWDSLLWIPRWIRDIWFL